MSMTKRKVAVACKNSSGEADLVIIEVEVNKDPQEPDMHYHMAEALADEMGYEGPYVCFDEHEQCNIKRVVSELAK